MKSNRRNFLTVSAAAGLSALGTSTLILRADAEPTSQSGELGSYGTYLDAEPAGTPSVSHGKWTPTEDNILGPFHRANAPYRAKITPPLALGKPLLVQGRVWAFDTKKPLGGAIIDIWQADHNGRYDNDDPKNPPKEDEFAYRARVFADEQGRYEYETIHPGRYQIGRNVWRPEHIHYLVRAPGYRELITQLYFEGDPHNKKDPWIKKSLTIKPKRVKAPGGTYDAGTFDIVLAPRKRG